jgi:hypothetical protein
VRSLLGTFADVYPYVALFSTIRDADLVMIGSERPLEFSAATLDAFVHSEPDVQADLDRIGIDSGADLLVRYQMDRSQLLRLAEGIERNTDDNMRIEYSAPLHLYDDTAESNFRALFSTVRPSLERVDGVEGRIELAQSYAEEEDWINALWTLKDANRLDADNATVHELYEEYQRYLKDALAGEEEEEDAPSDDDEPEAAAAAEPAAPAQ